MPWGAALESGAAWTALLEVDPVRSFGQAMVLATRHGAAALDVLVDAESSGAVARRAGLFDPVPTVWSVVGSELEPAVPTRLDRVGPPVIEPHVEALLTMPEVRMVVEHGVAFAECRGLEVARVVGVGAEQRLEVGVGVYDQGAFAVMHPDLTPQQSLAEVVAQVLEHRRRDAAPHPINRLVRERWLRSELLDEPGRAGLAALVAVEAVTPRDGLLVRKPAFAYGPGERVVVACSVGIDLDLVPAAAEVAAREGAERIVLVLPERDDHPVTRAVAARCRLPVEVHVAGVPWPSG